MSYAYREGKIYFHAARTGHKIDAIARCPKASFCVEDQDKIVPEKFTTHYRSAIAFGRIRVAEDPEEILTGLRALGEKYSPGRDTELEEEIRKELAAVAVLVLTVEHLTGKQAIELVPQPGEAPANENCKKEEFQCEPQNIWQAPRCSSFPWQPAAVPLRSTAAGQGTMSSFFWTTPCSTPPIPRS